MVQQVDVDGEIHEFPDEATPEMMQGALKKEAARQQFEQQLRNAQHLRKCIPRRCLRPNCQTVARYPTLRRCSSNRVSHSVSGSRR